MNALRPSRLRPLSAVKLWTQRSLASGGAAQFIVPLTLSLIAWVLLTGLLVLLLSTGEVSREGLEIVKSKLDDSSLFGISFFHLFTNGGQDLMTQGPGWLFVLLGTVLLALLTAVFTNFFDKAAADYLEGRSNYGVRDHIAFFGFDESSPDLLKQMLDGPYRECIFLVLTPSDAVAARRKLSASLNKKQMRQVILLDGSVGSVTALPRMQVEHAQEIHIFGEPVAAMECLELVSEDIVPSDCKPCYVMFEDRAAYAALQTSDLGARLKGKFEFFPMYRHEMWAHKALICRSLVPNQYGYLPLEGSSGIGPDSTSHVQIAIAGITPPGIALAIDAAHLGHYPNVIKHPECRTRISFIDPDVATGMQRLAAEFQGLFALARTRLIDTAKGAIDAQSWQIPADTEHIGGDFLDIEIEFIQAEISHPLVREYLSAAATDKDTRLTVAVCLPDANEGLGAASYLPQDVLERSVQVLVYQNEGSAVADAVSSSTTVSAHHYSRIRAFGMKSQAYDLDLISEVLQTARSWRADSAGDPAKNALSKSEAARMWSNIYNAAHVWTKLRSANSPDGNIPADMIDPLAMTEHNRWNAEQLLLRFRPLTKAEQQEALAAGEDFLEVKNRLKRERMAHLDICSWQRLQEIDPEVIQYDYNFVEQI